MELAYRYALVFFVVVLVSGGVLLVTFDAHQSDVTESTQASVEDRAETAATSLDVQFTEQQQVVDFATTKSAVVDHRSDRQTAALESFVETTAFDGVSVVNETGRVQSLVTDSGEQVSLRGADLGERTYVQRALAGDRYISEPFLAETGNFVVVMSAPLVIDGEVIGTLNGAYHLEETRLFEVLASRDDATAMTVLSGDVALYSNADRLNETITAGADLETTDWTVIAHHSQEDIDRAVHRLVLFQSLLALVLLGSLVGFGGWVYRAQIGRISTLLDRLSALERREYDAGPTLGEGGEWKQIDDALDQLSAALSRREQMLLVFNRILRHNIRNKLNVIRSRCELLEDDLDDPHREDVTEIRTATDDLLVLADRVRKTETLLDSVPEDSLRTDVAAEARKRAEDIETQEPSLTVQIDSPDTVYAACGTDIGDAIAELLTNVADHAGPKPTALVTVSTTDEHVSLRIEDDGEGIPPEEAAVISGDQSITQMRHTLGVGLWLASWIVHRYDGTLDILLAEESGTAVEITLPHPRNNHNR